MFEVYPENGKTLKVFLSMSTQWLYTGGMESHRCGLNHAVFLLHADSHGVPRKQRPAVLAGIVTMEHAALDVWAKAHAARK
ncbi:hypothetical protein BA896_012730 [Janthinobacterium lividum]|uniref:Uncharacterized protein n=1 Tax=Janthinobacterium lividum TaxID=29581 RepID=A0A1E8PTH0_9BURK|nr:hypothetical protein BA896_012730 [Janthinobacterium lividum]